jgi:hypothetical protein
LKVFGQKGGRIIPRPERKKYVLLAGRIHRESNGLPQNGLQPAPGISQTLIFKSAKRYFQKFPIIPL